MPIFPNICNFHFFQVFWFFPDLAILFFELFLISLYSLWSLHIFHHLIPFLYPCCIFLWFKTGSPIVCFCFFTFCKYLDNIRIHKFFIIIIIIFNINCSSSSCSKSLRGLVLWYISHCRLLMPYPFFTDKVSWWPLSRVTRGLPFQ